MPIPSLTTETETVVATPQGTFEHTRSLLPARVRKNGQWTPVDATLAARTDGTLSPSAVPSGLTLSGGGSGPLATMSSHGRQLKLVWTRSNLPKPEVSGDTATYRDVLPDVDLAVTANEQGGASPVLIVKSAVAAANPAVRELSLGYATAGLELRSDASRRLTALDTAGQPVFEAPAPTMWDSATSPVGGTPARAARSSAVRITADGDGSPADSSVHGPGQNAQVANVGVTTDDVKIALTPDKTLLASPTAVYPLYIDPNFNPVSWSNGSPGYVTIQSGCANSTNWGRTDDKYGTPGVGYNSWSGCVGIEHTYFQFPVDKRTFSSAANTVHVLKATLKTISVYSASCGASGTVEVHDTGSVDRNTTWNNAPGPGALLASQSIAPACTSQPATGFDVTRELQNASSSHWPNVTMVLIASNESSGSTAFKRFAKNPSLTVEYDTEPRVSSATTSPASSCSAGGKIGLTTIDLIAGVSDADSGAPVSAHFTLRTSTGAIPTTASGTQLAMYDYNPVATVNQRGTLIWPNIPALKSGDYVWTARADDGKYNSPATTCKFTVDSEAPPMPRVTSAVFRNDLPDGAAPPAPRTTGDFVFTPPSGVTDIVKYAYSWGTPPAAINPAPTVAARGGANPTTVPLRPMGALSNTLYVSAIDSAGNVSAAFAYTFRTSELSTPDAPGDFNGDGTPDLIAPDAAGNARLYPGTGAGRIGPDIALTKGKPLAGALIATGDFDLSNTQDLLVRRNDGNLYYYEGDGGGDPLNENPNGFEQVQNPLFDSLEWKSISQMAAVENTDGRASDLYVITGDQLLQVPALAGTASYDAPITLSAGWAATTLLGAGRVNGFPAFWARDDATGVLTRYVGTADAPPGSPTASKSVVATSGWAKSTRPVMTSAGDSNGDHLPDLWSMDRAANPTIWFHPSSADGRLGTAGVVRVPAQGDVTGDGIADLATIRNDGTLYVYPGDKDSGLNGQNVIQLGGATWKSIQRFTKGDFTGDGISDLVAIWDDGTLHLYKGDGTGKVTANTVVNEGGNTWSTVKQLTAGDFDGDGVADLMAVWFDGTLHSYKGRGDGQVAPQTRVNTGGNTWSTVKLLPGGDFTGDGIADLMAVWFDGTLHFYKGTGSGQVSDNVTVALGGNNWDTVKFMTSGDFTGDGVADLMAVWFDGTLHEYRGRGDGQILDGMAVSTGGNSWQSNLQLA
ncbi:FG-GAP-like repeat-containing protein [Streptomyces sp. NPDC056670]|uniref:FG-GAP-like repeat-containing protein n=1 Tax=Streptomyces sp. NPDC056670 TaxID=3345904 RepID=UPI00369DD47B